MTNSMMGPPPAVSSCACRICVPNFIDQSPSASDRDCIETVVRCGWQVVVVGGDTACDCCSGPPDSEDGPAFAYTVGLGHRAGHPELAMTGLPVTLMHHALNLVADRVVMSGLRLRPGDVIETALPNAPVVVDAVSNVGLESIGCVSEWFHRHPVEVLQLVWPTTSGVFGWQPGAPPELDALQPPAWRVPSPRTGGLAVDPPWPFPATPDTMVVVCTHLRQDNEPVRSVARMQDESGAELWDIYCGRDHGPGIDQLLMEHLAHTVRASPSLRDVADLRVGEYAERDDAFSPWRRGRLAAGVWG
jgi:hypothetical protein